MRSDSVPSKHALVRRTVRTRHRSVTASASTGLRSPWERRCAICVESGARGDLSPLSPRRCEAGKLRLLVSGASFACQLLFALRVHARIAKPSPQPAIASGGRVLTRMPIGRSSRYFKRKAGEFDEAQRTRARRCRVLSRRARRFAPLPALRIAARPTDRSASKKAPRHQRSLGSFSRSGKPSLAVR